MVRGVIIVSVLGFLTDAITKSAVFNTALSRTVPKLIRGPLQNLTNAIPGILTNQSVSRVYVE